MITSTASSPPDEVVVYQTETGKYRWNRKNGQNGKITGASSEDYENFKECYENFLMSLSSNYVLDVQYHPTLMKQYTPG